ncbi:MAG: hypothetical protein A3G39_07815 [Deltaproteobacteria bacterium RIFCSPLOWO2_12_FULL_43_16]|nr:MAG: hypothetical protein A2Z89_04990 [Deltaproteobacteria bacterium GWA2_43_19]OGQ12120.1 MAG: hypothetical protein A3D30_07220 [Deltaproteobacteria bacterium RIFCSPHIGHO2_02_FULL_43_33]OGQ61526.1 MAG: hypothetical protein A3G39_07815 [Deltaproteobacteria bacterium RIFCSPLOWO2_12_FULL_43_16]HBR16146.1 hypothetical protein [Deltaproteobacteria bacterium]
MTRVERNIEEIKEKLSPLFTFPFPHGIEGLQLIILFGSYASGKIHKKSDIDLAFLFDKSADILALTNKIIRLLHTDNMDIIDLRRASPLMRFSIAKKGKPLYEAKSGIFNEFYSLAFRMYIDTKKMRDAQKEAICHFLAARGLA